MVEILRSDVDGPSQGAAAMLGSYLHLVGDQEGLTREQEVAEARRLASVIVNARAALGGLATEVIVDAASQGISDYYEEAKSRGPASLEAQRAEHEKDFLLVMIPPEDRQTAIFTANGLN